MEHDLCAWARWPLAGKVARFCLMKHPNAEIRALIYAQAITVGVGTNESGNALSFVDLYPGGIVESIVLAQDYCSGMGVVCQAALAGLYDINDSRTVL